MAVMFAAVTASTLDLSSFDTRKVKTMERMFTGAKTVTGIDLSSFDTSKVQNMAGMFSNCLALTNLDLSSFDMSNVVDYTNMFGSSGYEAGITTLKTPKINPHDDIPLPRTLYSQDGTAYTTLPVTTGTSIELRESWD
jgi:surface protein